MRQGKTNIISVQAACDQCEMLKNLKKETREKLLSEGMVREYKKGELIFQERENVNRVYFVISGYIALYRINHNHDKKVIFVYKNGAMVNEVVLERPIASIGCQALKDVVVLSFSRKSFLAMMEQDFELTQRVMGSATKKIRRLYRQLGNTSNMVPLENQVASKLWKLGRDFGVQKTITVQTDEGDQQRDVIQIDFEMKITFLADMVGAKRESVSRIIKRMAEKQLVTCRNGQFYIYDVARLQKIATAEKICEKES